MRQRQAYTGIDIFRWAAAFLIVAIHTSPLASFSETGDFILTRVIARVAVPLWQEPNTAANSRNGYAR